MLGIEVSEIEADGKKISIINGIHKSEDGNTMLLPMNSESQGTWKLFSIMPSILTNLENGGLLCIDELDTKLHPLLFRKIVNMYCDKEINKKNAQLIFTTHSTMLFNSEYLRRDELYITDKDEIKNISNDIQYVIIRMEYKMIDIGFTNKEEITLYSKTWFNDEEDINADCNIVNVEYSNIEEKAQELLEEKEQIENLKIELDKRIREFDRKVSFCNELYIK